ncbi:hypothetical protein HMPREF1317_1618 [Schaalia georgiae F0490]|uniref:Uncharacterized protein n=1 Tax=Schaalia georgiae F0490 TaxID=1125717 RepID=J1HMH0_9ACTO|nr:hypothetical protein HMPREF1317_1618 [Schaalia georgiae F0490]
MAPSLLLLDAVLMTGPYVGVPVPIDPGGVLVLFRSFGFQS